MKRKEDVLRKFGKQVAFLRRQQHLTVGDLAASAHLDPSRIRDIEAGRVNLLFTTIIALAKGLGVNPQELLKSL